MLKVSANCCAAPAPMAGGMALAAANTIHVQAEI